VESSKAQEPNADLTLQYSKETESLGPIFLLVLLHIPTPWAISLSEKRREDSSLKWRATVLGIH
jgi:hypothetical protein